MVSIWGLLATFSAMFVLSDCVRFVLDFGYRPGVPGERGETTDVGSVSTGLRLVALGIKERVSSETGCICSAEAIDFQSVLS